MKIEFNHKITKDSLLKDDIYLEIDSESISLNLKTVSKEFSIKELKTIRENSLNNKNKNNFTI